ncbi:MAG: S8 family serine peptidase [Anaerolineae bacterium]|nr:S8 family serine peptidase [Anaerolineae bacterium]MCO5204111.1 S8 family serine peptidase [Anaerolineae bacterium]
MNRNKLLFLGIGMAAVALLIALFSLTSSSAVAADWQAKVDPWVIEKGVTGQTEYLVYLADQADISAADQLDTKAAKGAFVFDTLTTHAQRTQAPLIADLQKRGVEFQSFWVANMIWVRSDLTVAQALAQRSDVAYLFANPTVHLEEPMITPERHDPSGIEWNIAQIGAPTAWANGFTGQGIVIGGQDTGYDWDHPALINQYRGWNGASADHDYNWHDSIHSGGGVCGANSPEPCDDHSHGTHTMGTMVGDDGGSNQIGVAPGATWIGCRNMDQGNGTPATYTECYEWFIAPYPVGGDPILDADPTKAPHVINNSWSCPVSEGCTNPDMLLTVVNNVRAAGILTAHAAGNSGSSCGSINTPAAIYDASFTVGATDSANNIAGFSSRGPVNSFSAAPMFVNRAHWMKPDISAPGVGIRSSVPGGGYAGGWSGTSMATPHVAGGVALLLSAQPDLIGDVDAIEIWLQGEAMPRTTSQGCGHDLPTAVPNNVYGWGRLDVTNVGPDSAGSQPSALGYPALRMPFGK